MMSAAEARKQATSFNNTTVTRVLTDIEHGIAAAVTRGQTSTNVNGRSNDAVLVALRAEGYSVSHVNDQRDGSFYSISW